MGSGPERSALADDPFTALPGDVRAHVEGFIRAGDEIVNPFLERLNAEPVPEIIYHYTDGVGLRGILEKGTLRFGDIFYMNDPSELKHGVGTAMGILDEAATNADDRPEVRMFARQHREMLTSGIDVIAHYFICCFSRKGDELGQWRAYADNGRGYAIGFDGRELVRTFSADRDTNGQTFRLTYRDDILRDMLRRSVDLVVPLISLPREREFDEETLGRYMFALHTRLALQLLQTSVLFKHEGYVTEDEYRLLQLHRAGEVPNVKFREKPYTLARYQDFDWKARRPSVLRRIIIGPAADADEGRRFAKDCLKAFCPNLPDVEIAKSQIPYKPR